MGTYGRWRGTAVVTAGALLASLCLVAAPAGAATKPTGTLTVEAPGVTVLKKGTSDFTKGKTDQKIAIGDTIQTDASGLAQLKYNDGSITRLDHGTVFTVDKLVNKTGQRQIEGTVSAGQTWNRVQKLSESDTFTQKGNGASAVVGGTAFVTKCSLPSGTAFKVVKTKKQLKKLQKASKCDFTLVDGNWSRSSGPFRAVSPAELDLMATMSGLQLRERWASWQREPFTDASRKHVSVWQKPS